MTDSLLGSYTGHPRGYQWQETNLRLREGQRKLFSMNAGTVFAAFADCMALIAEPLRMVEDEHFKGVQGKAFLGILGLTYQLLQSSWLDNEEGRTAASTHTWRSIFEAPDYLMATWWSEKFASGWSANDLQERIKAADAMRIVQEQLNAKQSGLGDERKQRRYVLRNNLQIMSHVSTAAAGMAFAKAPGLNTNRFVPEGYNDQRNVLNAHNIVGLASQVVLALSQTVDEFMSSEWKQDSWEIMSAINST